MKPLQAHYRFDLGHRAYFLRLGTESSTLLAASKDGDVSLIDVPSETTKESRLSTKLRSIWSHPTKPLIALVDGASGLLVVQDLAGRIVVEIQPPQLADDDSSEIERGFADCHFDESGDFLWLIAPLSADEHELRLIETTGWSVVHRAVVGDPFGASDCSFHRTGRPSLVSLWIAAGQDGQQVCWLKRDKSTFTVEQLDAWEDCIPPVFSSDGSEFLMLTNFAIRRYDFATMTEMGSLEDPGEDDSAFAESLCYLDSQHALASTNEGRMFLIDLSRMAIEDEIAIEGHEPRPIGEYYPNLAKESGWATDISWFARVDDTIVFIYRRDKGTLLQGWKDSILCYSPSE